MKDTSEQPWDTLVEADQPLSPRHRRLCELAAMGKKNIEIAKELGFSEGRISVLLANSKIQTEIHRIQDRVFDESIGKRIKFLAGEAADAIEACLRDTSRANASRRISTAIWLSEQLNGRATQRHEVSSEVSLGTLMDRLDSMKLVGKSIAEALPVNEKTTGTQPRSDEPQSEEDTLDEWVRNFS